MTAKEEHEELVNKIKRGLEISQERLRETKRRNNSELIVLDKNQQIVRIKP
jgi:hypothetical protein